MNRTFIALGVLILPLFGTAQVPAKPAVKTCAVIARHTPAALYCDLIENVATAAGQPRKDAAAALVEAVIGKPQRLAPALDYSVFDALFQHAQDTRVDKQTQAPVTANGTSSLVSLPGATDFVSVAVSSGALTQSTSGTTTTFGFNLGQVIGDFSKSNSFDYSLKGVPVLQNIDATVSMGVNPATASVPVTPSSDGSTDASTSAQISSTGLTVTGATARYQFFNKFDPKSPQFQNSFKQAIEDASQQTAASKDLLAKTANLLAKHFTAVDNDHSARDTAAAQIAASQTTEQIVEAFNAYFDKVKQQLNADPTFASDFASFVAALNADLSLYRSIVAKAKGVPAITAEYTFTNVAGQPQTHNGRVIIGLQSVSGKMLSINVAATAYGPLPQGVTSHFRDFQASAQADLPVSISSSKNALDFSVAGYGQYQQSASLLSVSANDLPSGFPAGAPPYVAGTQGWLGVFQAKVTIHGPNGVQIVPVSWKWSNRTNLFTQADSSFQFGLSYDVSSLGQLFGGSH